MRHALRGLVLSFALLAASGASAQDPEKNIDDLEKKVRQLETKVEIQGLAERVRRLEEETEQLHKEVAALKAELAELKEAAPRAAEAPARPSRAPAPRSRMIFNQSNAGAALRQLTSHEAVMRQGDYDRNGQLDYWTRDIAGFACLHDAADRTVALIDLAFARADAAPAIAYPELGGSLAPKQGYLYKAMKTDQDGNPYVQADAPAPTAKNAPAGACTNQSHFGFCAYPAVYGSDGFLTFIVNEDGVVWQKELGPDAKGVDDRQKENPETVGSGWSQYGG